MFSQTIDYMIVLQTVQIHLDGDPILFAHDDAGTMGIIFEHDSMMVFLYDNDVSIQVVR